MKHLKVPVLWLVLASTTLPLLGCDEGAFEEAGEEVDDAVDDAGDAIDRRN
jgi:hypothetical protein